MPNDLSTEETDDPVEQGWAVSQWGRTRPI